MCDFTFEETVRQRMSHSELEIGSEESTHIAIFRDGEEEEKIAEGSLSAPGQFCSLREKKCQMFSCSFCLRTFSSKYRLIIHVFVHIDGVQPPKFVCRSCGEVFPCYVSLQKHLKFSEADHDSPAEKEEPFYCSGEQGSILQYDQEYSVMDHIGRQCSSNRTVNSFADKFNTHITTHNVEIPDRNDNNGTFDTTSKVNVHTVPCLEKRSHKYDVCQGSFTFLSLLKTHGLMHTERKHHKCDICGKSFTQLSHLKNHALIHTGTRRHKCDICGKSFTQLSHLKRHALIHTRTIYKCDICGKYFTQLSDLKSHSLIHTGILSHKCDICGKFFTLLGGLKRHALIHTGTRPHKCEICGKYFTQLSNLKRHALIHTRTNSHKCDICGKYFTSLGGLKRHALIHTGMTPHM